MKKKRVTSLLLIIMLLTIFMFQLQNVSVLAVETESDEVSGYETVANNTEFYIKNANSGQYLDLDHGTDANNANIHQWKYNGQKNQRWKFVRIGTVGYDCLYKIVSVNSSTGRVVDVSKGGASNNLNVALYQYKGSSNQQFALKRNPCGSYAILTGCSNFKSSLTVQSKSCTQGANVMQYSYNKTHNDEWYLEPVSRNKNYGIDYSNRNSENSVQTVYPYIKNGDCTNYVSQCLVSSGVHYQGNWYMYKKNNNNLKFDCKEVDKLNASWQVSSPSPWISAKYFASHWSSVVYYASNTGSELHNNLKCLNSRFGIGDVVQYGTLNLWGGFQPEHTMYITGRSGNELLVSYHSNDKKNKSLNTMVGDNPNKMFRFYDFI